MIHQKIQVRSTEAYKVVLGVGFPLHKPYSLTHSLHGWVPPFLTFPMNDSCNPTSARLPKSVTPVYRPFIFACVRKQLPTSFLSRFFFWESIAFTMNKTTFTWRLFHKPWFKRIPILKQPLIVRKSLWTNQDSTESSGPVVLFVAHIGLVTQGHCDEFEDPDLQRWYRCQHDLPTDGSTRRRFQWRVAGWIWCEQLVETLGFLVKIYGT